MAVQTIDVVDVARRFEALPTATIFDIMDHRGVGDCCLSLEIAPLGAQEHLAGPAFTIRTVRDPRSAKEWTPPEMRRISHVFSPMSPGEVVVVDGGGDRTCGHWGEMLSMMARRSGVRGVVVDGGTRDSAAIRALDDWAAFVRFTSPVEQLSRMRMHELQIPVLLDGAHGGRVLVRPGDWMVADRDAVLVIPVDDVVDVLEASEKLEVAEEDSRRAILAGEDLDEVFRRFGRA